MFERKVNLDVIDEPTPVPTIFVLPREGSEDFHLNEWETENSLEARLIYLNVSAITWQSLKTGPALVGGMH
jgi:hypothetical protein